MYSPLPAASCVSACELLLQEVAAFCMAWLETPCATVPLPVLYSSWLCDLPPSACPAVSLMALSSMLFEAVLVFLHQACAWTDGVSCAHLQSIQL